MTQPKLFSPIQIGSLTLSHRVALAPLTRLRANSEHVPSELAIEYYTQRASVPGTLLISEGILVAARATGVPHVPGIWNNQQITAWRKITDAVHAKGSYIYAQLWAVGRNGDPTVIEKEGPFPYISSSDVPLKDISVHPRPLTIQEIKEYIQLFSVAAYNAVRLAGFDGIEVHCANGYLVDQFLQDVCNTRTDEYGGSLENRCRFALEIMEAVCTAIGEEKTGFRVSPWSEFGDMRMMDPKPTFSYLVSEARKRLPGLAYLHVTEPRMSGGVDRAAREGESNDFLREIWSPSPVISAGGYTPETAVNAAERKGDIIAFGRYFISNPDLPVRLAKHVTLTKYNRSTFYTIEDPVGYIDYPFDTATSVIS